MAFPGHTAYCLRRCWPPQREVAVLRDVHGLSPRDVATTVGLTVDDERDPLNQARGQLRARLDRNVAAAGVK